MPTSARSDTTSSSGAAVAPAMDKTNAVDARHATARCDNLMLRFPPSNRRSAVLCCRAETGRAVRPAQPDRLNDRVNGLPTKRLPHGRPLPPRAVRVDPVASDGLWPDL